MKKLIRKHQSGALTAIKPPKLPTLSVEPVKPISTDALNRSVKSDFDKKQLAGTKSVGGGFGQGFNNMLSNPLIQAGIGTVSGILSNLYLPTNTMGEITSTAKNITANMGNPIFNMLGDAASGGIMKAAGFNNKKMIGAADAGLDSVANVLSGLGPWGMVASGALKIGNSLTGSAIDKVDLNARVLRSSGFAGTVGSINKTSDKYGGGAIGGLGTLFGEKRKALEKINDANSLMSRLTGILNTADLQKQAAENSTYNFGMQTQTATRNNNWMYNGTIGVAKQGGALNRNSEVNKFAKGGKTKFVSSLRSIDDLIKYANEKNPEFINRIINNDNRILDFTDDEGKQTRGTHYLEWGTDDSGKAIVYPRILVDGDSLKLFNSKDAYFRALELNNYLEMSPDEAKIFTELYKNKYPTFFLKFADGGKMNVIPEGALHARKHNLDIDGITKKGIPVITEDGGKVTQHAEIELNEIIFTKEITDKIEDLRKKYKDTNSKKEKDEIALKLGELITFEILENTDDKTGILLTVL